MPFGPFPWAGRTCDHPPEVPVQKAVSDGVARLTLDKPPVNALDSALIRDLDAAIDEVSREEALRLVILQGGGRTFSAGVDVGEHLGDAFPPLLRAFEQLAFRLLDLDVPTLAVVHGAALGGALEVALCCDLTLVADDAKLGVPEITLGVVPPIAAAVLPRIVGAQRAAGIVFTGETILGADAARMGLVWKSVPADRLAAEAESAAALFRSRSAVALRLAKRTIRATRDLSLREAIQEADELSARVVPELADAQEGLRAFMEKRKPEWRHR